MARYDKWYIRHVSIHAPSRERQLEYLLKNLHIMFQSTLPHGSDQCSGDRPGQRNNFNPRSLTGATTRVSDCQKLIGISIHAPSRERPLSAGTPHVSMIISIHAPSRERRNDVDCQKLIDRKFQSTLPHGSDHMQHSCILYYDFNPRSREGATNNDVAYTGIVNVKSSRRSREGATASKQITSLFI